jgi:hypothetical protein
MARRRGPAPYEPARPEPPTVHAVYRSARHPHEDGPAACFGSCPFCRRGHCVPVPPGQAGELVVTAPCSRFKFLRVSIAEPAVSG